MYLLLRTSLDLNLNNHAVDPVQIYCSLLIVNWEWQIENSTFQGSLKQMWAWMIEIKPFTAVAVSQNVFRLPSPSSRTEKCAAPATRVHLYPHLSAGYLQLGPPCCTNYFWEKKVPVMRKSTRLISGFQNYLKWIAWSKIHSAHVRHPKNRFPLHSRPSRPSHLYRVHVLRNYEMLRLTV